ncbi:hypothetical protein VTK73DRAFT_1655 [Phialemonium thermophilum]|uniref:Uncharacterized protein n=1 Tax=Phialemonium thermophilum TaxID=223376 RepID=A0ABR3VT68_9PEZI
MAPKETEYEPLTTASVDESEGTDEHVLRPYATRTAKQRWGRAAWVVCVLALVLSNAAWIGVYRHQKDHPHDFDPILGSNTLSVMSEYVFSSPYVEGNLTEMNQRWRDMFPRGGGAVKVDPQWAVDHQLQPTQGYAKDGKAIYVVAMYHQLHCLTVIRTSLYQSHNGRDQIDDWGHVTHCLDTLRQAIQCLADPTLGGVGVRHQCRDFEALLAWTVEHAYTDNVDEMGL